MRIADSASFKFQQSVQRSATPPARQASDVSREERMQLLTNRPHSQISIVESATYGERAQLLSVSGTPRQLWVV